MQIIILVASDAAKKKGVLMFYVILGLIIIGFSVFVGGALFLSILPEWVQDSLDLGCGCLVALFGLLIVAVPVILIVLWLIGTFCCD